jgi:serine/threonine protein phosphatase 1
MGAVQNLFSRLRQLPSTAPGERIFAVGDLHGRLDLLRDLLERLKQDVAHRVPSPTRLILLGDMVDRGPSSRQLIECVQRLQKNTSGVIALCGNHEDMLLQSAAGNGTVQQVWIDNGGDETLRSYSIEPSVFLNLTPAVRGRVLTRTLGEETIRWLNSLPLSYRSGDYFFCHAGVRPGVALEDQRREDLLWIRKEFLVSRRYHGAVIVHGHSETNRVEMRRNRINIDTAAYVSDELTALGLQGSSRWLVSTLDAVDAEPAS